MGVSTICNSSSVLSMNINSDLAWETMFTLSVACDMPRLSVLSKKKK